MMAWAYKQNAVNLITFQLLDIIYTFCMHKILSGSVVNSVQAILFLMDCKDEGHTN